MRRVAVFLHVAAGAADPVGVMFVVAGDIVVDDRVHIRDVDTTGRHIGSHQHFQPFSPETVHHIIPLCLTQVTVQGITIDPVFL